MILCTAQQKCRNKWEHLKKIKFALISDTVRVKQTKVWNHMHCQCDSTTFQKKNQKISIFKKIVFLQKNPDQQIITI